MIPKGCACTSKDLFLLEDFKQFKPASTYLYLAPRVLRDAMRMMIDDVVDNDVDIQMPGGSNGGGHIKVIAVADDTFKKARKRGGFADVDFLASNFQAYKLVYALPWTKRRVCRDVNIYVSGENKKTLIEKTNSGKPYLGLKQKRYLDYVPGICAKYPDLNKKLIIQIFKRGFTRLNSALTHGCHFYIPKYKTLYIGSIYTDVHEFYKEYAKALALKLKFLHKVRRIPNDGYVYYVERTDNDYSLIKTYPMQQMAELHAVTLHKVYRIKREYVTLESGESVRNLPHELSEFVTIGPKRLTDILTNNRHWLHEIDGNKSVAEGTES